MTELIHCDNCGANPTKRLVTGPRVRLACNCHQSHETDVRSNVSDETLHCTVFTRTKGVYKPFSHDLPDCWYEADDDEPATNPAGTRHKSMTVDKSGNVPE